MGWTMTETQFNSWQGQDVFLFPKNMKNSSGVHPASCSVSTGGFSQVVKQGSFAKGTAAGT